MVTEPVYSGTRATVAAINDRPPSDRQRPNPTSRQPIEWTASRRLLIRRWVSDRGEPARRLQADDTTVVSLVEGGLPIGGDDRLVLLQSLGNEHPIEGVLVVMCQAGEHLEGLDRDRQHLKMGPSRRVQGDMSSSLG